MVNFRDEIFEFEKLVAQLKFEVSHFLLYHEQEKSENGKAEMGHFKWVNNP